MNNQNFYRLILWSVFGIILYLAFGYAVDFIANIFKLMLSFFGSRYTINIVDILIRMAEIAFILVFGLKFINPKTNKDQIKFPKVFFIIILAGTPLLYFTNMGLNYLLISKMSYGYMYDYGSYIQTNIVIGHLFYFLKYSAIAIVAIILLIKHRNNN